MFVAVVAAVVTAIVADYKKLLQFQILLLLLLLQSFVVVEIS